MVFLLSATFLLPAQEFQEDREMCLPAGKPISTPVKWINHCSKLDTSEYLRILDQAGFEGFIKRASVPMENPPTIDFTTHMVLAYVLRVKEWYSVERVDIVSEGNALRMVVRAYKDLHRKERASSDHTSVSFVVIPRSEKKVEFFFGYYTWAPECSRFTRPVTLAALKE